MQNEGDIIKIALNIDNKSVLYKINKNDSLQKIINDICKEHNKKNASQFGLQFVHTPNGPSYLANKYVTEDNFSQIKDGYMFNLVGSITYNLEWIFLKTTPEDLNHQLQYLQNFCNDPGVLKEMVKSGYQNKVPAMVIKYKDDNGYLYSCLKSLSSILKNGIQLNTINVKFIEFLVQVIKDKDDKRTVTVLTISLQLLNQIMNNDYESLCVTNLININDVIPYFWRDENIDLQTQTVALLNNIIRKLDKDKINFINELKLSKNKNTIYKYLTANAKKCSELSHELCVLQSFILSSYQPLLKELVNDCSNLIMNININSNQKEAMIDFEEQDAQRSRLNTFNSHEFDNHHSRLSRANSRDNQIDQTMLRHKNISIYNSLYEPILITRLTYKCMEYYKSKYEKNYQMSVLQTQYHPGFFLVCDQITHFLCDILYINKPPEKDASLYIPLLFGCKEKPFFEEMFCRAVWLLAKTRREMRAKVDEDHEKVLEVLKEQIIMVLIQRPNKYKDLTEKLKEIVYIDVFNKWEKDRNEKWHSFLKYSPSLKGVKEKLLPNIKDLVRDQRFQVLQGGQVFQKLPEKRSRHSYWRIALTKNNKILAYGDYDPETNHYTTHKTEVSVNQILHVTTGHASRHVKGNKVRKELIPRCFSLLLEKEGEGLDFLAPDETTAQQWIDGFHLLLGKPAESKSYQSHVDMLLTMELNIHLIELQNITIPTVPPPIPPLPKDCIQKPTIPEKSDQLRQSIIKRRTVNASK